MAAAVPVTVYEMVADWLRPLTEKTNLQWDYCVIWKLGDDPSRFIQWGACCCSGGGNNNNNILRIKSENNSSHLLVVDECKDQLIKHPVTTHACNLLAKLPDAIPLYSGIHGDVLMSKKASWLHSDDEPHGTQVLIPTAFGLIELFSSKHLPEDQKLTDFISSQFKVPFTENYMSHKANMNLNLGGRKCHPHPLDLLPNSSNCDQSCTSSLLYTDHQPPRTECRNFLETVPTKSNGKDVVSQKSNSRSKKKSGCDLGYKSEEMIVQNKKKAEKGPYKSKNLQTERNRRERIKNGMYTLRSLVPNISKMDRMATLDDAANYIVELQKTIERYCDELMAMEKEKSNTTNDNGNVPKLLTMDCVNEKDPSFSIEMTPMEVQLIEVSQAGKNGFLLKFTCKKMQGGVSRLMEAINTLGLLVTDANVTTFDDTVLNILKLEADRRTDLEPNAVKESLIQLLK